MRPFRILALVAVAAVAACRSRPTIAATPADRPLEHAVVPIPATIHIEPRDSFLVTPRTVVYIDGDANADVDSIGAFAANLISNRAGAMAQRLSPGAAASDSSVTLHLDATRGDLGVEGYQLDATS